MECVARHAPATETFATELIVGELLSNVVKHTPGIIEVSLAWSAPTAMLAVEDRGAGFVPSAQLPTDEYSENGRGTFLITTLAQDVRFVSAEAGGSRVEVDLPVASIA